MFCVNETGTGLVKVYYPARGVTPSEQVAHVIEMLKEPPADSGCPPVLPDTVSAPKFQIDGGIVSLYFGESYRELKNLDEKIVRAAIVESVLQIDSVTGVSMYIADQPLKDKDGNKIGILTEDDYVQGASAELNAYADRAVTLYFADESGERLVPVESNVKYNSNHPVEKLIVERLLKGPTEPGIYATINPQANLLGVTVKDQICYINFDREFLNPIQDISPEVVIYSIVDSVLSGSRATSVQFTVNGDTKNMFMGKLDLSEPIYFSDRWIAD